MSVLLAKPQVPAIQVPTLEVQVPTLGLFENIPQDAYRKAEGISFTGLVRLSQSPAHYQDYLNNPPKPTPAMILGTAIHLAVLENGLDTRAIVCAPKVDKRTKDGKAQWSEFEAQNVGKLILGPEDYETVEQVTLAVRRNKTAAALLNPDRGKAEQSAFWKDPETGVICKCRPDFFRDDGIVIDVKSTQDASMREFQRTLGSFKYHWQSAFYLDGLSQTLEERLNQFIHIVIEKGPPYGVGIYVLDDVSIERARADIDLALAVYKKCMNEDRWPGYPDTIQNISLPNWMW